MNSIANAHLSIVGPWLLSIVLFALLMGSVVVLVEGDPLADAAFVAFAGGVGVWAITQSTVGTLIAARQPHNRLGRLLQAGGALVASVFAGFVTSAVRGLTTGTDDVIGGLAGWWGSVMIFPAIFVAFPLVGIVFPDGCLPGRRWRLPVIAIAVGIGGSSVMYAVAEGPLSLDLPNNPVGFVRVPGAVVAAVGQAATLLLVASMVLAVVAIVGRWRRGRPLERAQLKWMLAALTMAAVLFPLTFGGDAIAGPTVLTSLSVGSVTLVPLAIGIAVLRYRLYDIDRLLSRTLAYALVTVILVATFAAGNLALQTALAGITQGGTVAVAASTLVAFALAQPLLRRVRTIVDRRFDRARIDADRTAATFAERVRDEVVLDRLAGELVATTESAFRPTQRALWLRGAPVPVEGLATHRPYDGRRTGGAV